MSASPITGEDLGAITDGATACDHLAELSNTREKVQDFLEWLLEDDGTLTDGFLEQLIAQLLVDEDKLGWFVQTDATTGELELIELIPLTGLDDGGAADGDYLMFDGDNWVKQSPIYLAPTSGGTTLPSPNAGGTLSVAHGFGDEPRQFACYIECSADDAGYVAGQRVNLHSLMGFNGASEIIVAASVYADDDNIYASFRNYGGSGAYQLINASTGAKTTIDVSKWNVKFYAMP